MKRPLLLLILVVSLSAMAQPTTSPLSEQLFLKELDLGNYLPANEINTVYQDPTGFLWIGTTSGLYRYDGYSVRPLRKDIQNPALLTSNYITCLLSTDDGNTLWVGTRNGLNRLDLTGTVPGTAYHLTEFDNTNFIVCLCATSDGSLWVGTEGGLFCYEPDADSFTLYCDQMGNSKVPHASVNSLFEDPHGFLWVGTWDAGLYRMSLSDTTCYQLPKFNDQNSAQTVYVDAQDHLWVGTWGSGVYEILNPYDTDRPLAFHSYVTGNTDGLLPSNIIWNITYDAGWQLLWLGTSQGLAYIDLSTPVHRVQTLSADLLPTTLSVGRPLFGHGASVQVGQGIRWIHARKQGIVLLCQRQRPFCTRQLPADLAETNGIKSLAFDGGGNLWVGLSNGGIVVYPAPSDSVPYRIPAPSRLLAIRRGEAGRMLIATERQGLLVMEGATVVDRLNTANTPWLLDNCVYDLCHMADGTLLLGTWKGISVRFTNGKGLHLGGDSLSLIENARVKSLSVAPNGDIWLAASGQGILCLRGNIHKPASLSLSQYDRVDGSPMPLDDVTQIVADGRGNVWACTQDGALLRYIPERDELDLVNDRLNLPYDGIYSIRESRDGNLWLGLRYDLACICFDTLLHVREQYFFPRQDVLKSDFFGEGLSDCGPDGRLAFGGLTCVATFDDLSPSDTVLSTRVAVTDIKVFGRSIDGFTPFTQRVTLQPDQRDVTIEFSSFNYDNTGATRFTYRLEGYDKQWRYNEPNTNKAHYTNLPPGSYTFRLRSIESGGGWRSDEFVLPLTVLAPLWLRWPALVLYVLLALAAGGFVVLRLRRREQEKRCLQMERFDAQSREQLNHKKLQFFTSITHELMTPLSVISASLAAIEQDHPGAEGACRVISSNVNRLFRYLQQILEFRRSETGNEHLRLSHGNLTEFMRGEVESMLPLAKKQQLHLSLVCNPEQFDGWFDPDKLDKIVYNLISNAIKYNRPMGYIQVALTCDDGHTATISVKDNGVGIAPDKLPSLFQRFYEGEHRRYSTYGTGIGLSLVKDLVQLHRGSVHVQSQLGQGSEFIVSIPIHRDAFEPEELDDTSTIAMPPLASPSQGADAPLNPAPQPETAADAPAVLVVEDDDDLQALLRKLLASKYRVFTAYNGQEALQILEAKGIDLIITDVMMPVMDGMEFVRHLRQDERTAAIPVIMLTAKRAEQDRAEAYRCGANAYMMKPFNTSVLLARLENLLRHRQRETTTLNEQLFGGIKGVHLSDADADFLSQCNHCAQAHISDAEFDVQAFADELCTSKSTLYRRLKSLTGLNPNAFIRKLRMTAACELLRQNPHARVADIAYAVGYNDPKYFSACFKKDIGSLPHEYLAQGQQADD